MKRKPRKSTTTLPKTFIQPVATDVAIKHYEALERACVALVIGQDREGNKARRERIDITWPFKGRSKSKLDIPEGFPKGLKVVDSDNAIHYNASTVLIWLYEQGLSKFTPNKIYKERIVGTKVLTEFENVCNIEASLEKMLNIGEGLWQNKL